MRLVWGLEPFGHIFFIVKIEKAYLKIKICHLDTLILI